MAQRRTWLVSRRAWGLTQGQQEPEHLVQRKRPVELRVRLAARAERVAAEWASRVRRVGKQDGEAMLMSRWTLLEARRVPLVPHRVQLDWQLPASGQLAARARCDDELAPQVKAQTAANQARAPSSLEAPAVPRPLLPLVHR